MSPTARPIFSRQATIRLDRAGAGRRLAVDRAAPRRGGRGSARRARRCRSRAAALRNARTSRSISQAPNVSSRSTPARSIADARHRLWRARPAASTSRFERPGMLDRPGAGGGEREPLARHGRRQRSARAATGRIADVVALIAAIILMLPESVCRAYASQHNARLPDRPHRALADRRPLHHQPRRQDRGRGGGRGTDRRRGHAGRGECVPYARYGETVESVVAAIEAHARRRSPAGSTALGLQDALPPAPPAMRSTARSGTSRPSAPAARPTSSPGCRRRARSPPPIRSRSARPTRWPRRPPGPPHRPLLKVKLGGAGDAGRASPRCARAAPAPR